jgi:hypothetical protein
MPIINVPDLKVVLENKIDERWMYMMNEPHTLIGSDLGHMDGRDS